MAVCHIAGFSSDPSLQNLHAVHAYPYVHVALRTQMMQGRAGQGVLQMWMCCACTTSATSRMTGDLCEGCWASLPLAIWPSLMDVGSMTRPSTPSWACCRCHCLHTAEVPVPVYIQTAVHVREPLWLVLTSVFLCRSSARSWAATVTS